MSLIEKYLSSAIVGAAMKEYNKYANANNKNKASQPVMINDLEFDALISEDKTLEAEIPEYAIETGYVVSDAIIRKPIQLEMTLIVTDTPVTWKKRHASKDRVKSITKRLEELYLKGEPVTIKTCDATYKDMAIASLTISKNVESGRFLREIPISFKQIIVTTSKTTTIPDSYGKSGTSEDYDGDADVEASNGGGGDEDNRESTTAHGFIFR